MRVYLSGEIHTEWRKEIIDQSKNLNFAYSIGFPLMSVFNS